jgi:hypothetical protein
MSFQIVAQTKTYWNQQTQLIPWRPSFEITKLQYVDLDKDGDPDIISCFINDTIPVVWIDDDDDMKQGDWEGDTDNDCLLIDRNRDGIFAGPMDFSIDWSDEDGDGKADIQLIINNAGTKVRNYFDWGADYMYVIDVDKDQIMHFVNWNDIMMRAWEHNGHANFYKDYHGNSTFLKMHASSFRISNLAYNWENPFLFFDTDRDGLTEMAIRLVDTPEFRSPKQNGNSVFGAIDSSYDVLFTRKINYAAITWDLDNDNAAGNEFDFDMSILFKGKGFTYDDQGHRFSSIKGIKGEEKYFFDHRWRNINELFFPDRDTAYQLIFSRGDWQECRLVFDEDDDCNRWERVEFYDPKDLWKTGIENGGLDHNGQADAVGDRGEFDMDNSGKGNLYIGAFDGKIHLYGAEWGAWRIDQTAFSFQGFGGFYEKWNRKRLQLIPSKFAVVKYKDTNGNGFIDWVGYDLDGDQQWEDSVSLFQLGISDQQPFIQLASQSPTEMQKLFKKLVGDQWQRAKDALQVAKKMNINTQWYAFYQQPHSIQEQYDYAFWLNFYIYQDLRFIALHKYPEKVSLIDKAFYSGNWKLLF